MNPWLPSSSTASRSTAVWIAAAFGWTPENWNGSRERAAARPGALTRALAQAKGDRHGKRRCPRCRRKLRVIYLEGDGAEIELDRCPRGDGLWLDRGEMQSLIAAFGRGGRTGEEEAVATFFADFYGKKPTSSAPNG